MYTLLFVFFAISILFSFLCSLWEAVLLSITPSYAEVQLKEGTAVGRKLHLFKANIDQPLAAILTLNTIAHTAGAIGVGAQATKIWADSNPLITGAVIPVLMTLGILVLSEIIPKTMGAVHWKRLTPFTVRSLSFIIFALYPLVWVSQLITGMLKTKETGSVFSRGDFVAMAEIGARTGALESGESEMLASLLRFNEVVVKSIMTPRTVVVAAPESQPIEEFLDAHETLHFSRIPIYEAESTDHFTGYVLKDELLDARVAGKGQNPLSSLRRDILAIPRDYALPKLFHQFAERREHIALVVDEYGVMSGIVTMEDVIETLLGHEIVDELDRDADMQDVARAAWEKRTQDSGLVTDEVPEAPGKNP